MSLTTIRYDREQLERAIKTVESEFPDKIERIGYTVRGDWAGDPALYFRVLLKDSSDTEGNWWLDKSLKGRILALTRSITTALGREVQADDLQPYYSFRTVSEQAQLRDPVWD